MLTIDGGLPGNTGRRLLNVSDGDALVNRPFTISGVRLLRGRALDSSSACMFSTETTTITDVTFDSCESVGGPNQQGFGGALGIGNTNTAGNYRPNVTVSNSVFQANRSTRGTNTANLTQVGAAFFGSGTRMVGTVQISNTRFLGNSSESIGAMLIQDATSVALSSSQFISNVATGTAAFLNGGRFGGFRIQVVSGNVDITAVATVGNTANQERGGFSIATIGGTTTITNGDVLGNIALSGRIGGFEVLTDSFDVNGNCLANPLRGSVIINGLDVESNRAATNTAGFRVICSKDVTISNMGIKSNGVFGSPVAGSGGNSAGQVNSNAAVTMTNVQVLNNRTFAGAVDGGFGVLTVFDNQSFTGSRFLVRDNYASQSEGGLTLRANGAGRAFNLADSAFVDNSTGNGISALLLDKTGNYAIRNTTLSGNSSTTGGAIFVNMLAASGSNTVLFENVTSARNGTGNLAFEAGSFGTPGAPNGTLTITNSILGSGTGGIGFASTNMPAITNVTYAISNSLIENNLNAPAGICGANGNKCNLNARLENLAANGGPTPTHALRPGSPALDAGTAVASTFDQRGSPFSRSVGVAVDMGAFESPVLLPLCTLDVDGSGGTPDALTDGLLLMRAMFGLTGVAVTNGATTAGAPRADWTSIRNYLNGSC
ncbi:MAG: choice-of-anchor Q domain-containing protein, partial [Sphingomicrobium sp.]